jgi:hypothetical protein
VHALRSSYIHVRAHRNDERVLNIVFFLYIEQTSMYKGVERKNIHMLRSSGSCGASCKHNLGDYGKMLFAMARDRSLPKLALLVPQGSHEDVWKWMFTSRIPGILQLFGGLMETS